MTDAKHGRVSRQLFLLALPLLLAACRLGIEDAPDRITGAGANFGAYETPAAAVWDGWRRRSVHVPGDDGTNLAVDYLLPTRDGEGPDEPVPVVLRYTRSIRAMEREDGTVDSQADYDPILQHLLRHGYAVAVADARGTGASFGAQLGPSSVEETKDSYAIIQWIASQPWSNGNVGMLGRFYDGMTQYHAAAQAPPALRAIFVEMAAPSAYDFVFRGGAFKKNFVEIWGALSRDVDLGKLGMPAPVDADDDGRLRDRAVAEHADNVWALELFAAEGARLRDFELDGGNRGYWSWDVIHTIDDTEAIASSGVGIYHLVGWYDIFTTQQAWLYASLDPMKQKMMIGPWLHSGGYGGPVHKAELLRWFDYWLKGIDNGVLDEPPVHYYVMKGNHTVPEDALLTGAEDDSDPGSITRLLDLVTSTLDETAAENPEAWVPTSDWPPREVEHRRFYFAGGPSSTVDSVNDGALIAEDAPFLPPSATPPAQAAAADRYTVDYTSRVGAFSRWMEGYGARRAEPLGTSFFDERTAEDRKALTYTTAPLEEEITILGYPTVRLWVTSTHDDGDFFAYLEEVDGEGRAHYVSEGVLRASHRKTSAPPFDNFGLPYHRSFAEDIEPLVPGEPTQLDFDLMGTAIVIDAGHRIRITIAGADAANFELHPDQDGRDAPTIEILRGGEHASFVELPLQARGPGMARAFAARRMANPGSP